MPPVPVPETVMSLKAGLASSLISAAERLGPTPWGVKVTVMLQEALTARAAGQLLVWVKSEGLGSMLRRMLEMLTVAAVVLVTVTTWGAPATPTVWLPKAREEALRVRPEVGAVAVVVRMRLLSSTKASRSEPAWRMKFMV